jgi:hypothetical protein
MAKKKRRTTTVKRAETPRAKKQTSTRKSKKRVSVAALRATAQPATLDDWFASLRTVASERAEAGNPRGACLVPNPVGGPRLCVVVDAPTCKAMKGRFVWGPC